MVTKMYVFNIVWRCCEDYAMCLEYVIQWLCHYQSLCLQASTVANKCLSFDISNVYTIRKPQNMLRPRIVCTTPPL